MHTISSGSYQTSIGVYNTHNNTEDLFVIGNGVSDSSRSNILRVSTNNVSISGSLNVRNGITSSLFGTSSITQKLFGGTNNYIPLWSGSNEQTSSRLYQSGSSIGINATSFNNSNPESLLISGSTINILSGEANINNYAQLNIVNKNSGSSSSADIVATNNIGNENGNFVDLGINSNNFAGLVGGPNEGYLYHTGSNFIIGNTTPGGNGNLKFFAGNNAINFHMVISSSGNIGIGTATPSVKLQVSGTLRAQNYQQLDGYLYASKFIML